VVAFPLSLRSTRHFLFSLLCGQLRVAKPILAILYRHSSTLRVLGWLYCPKTRALCYFQSQPSLTLHFIYFLIWKFISIKVEQTHNSHRFCPQKYCPTFSAFLPLRIHSQFASRFLEPFAIHNSIYPLRLTPLHYQFAIHRVNVRSAIRFYPAHSLPVGLWMVSLHWSSTYLQNNVWSQDSYPVACRLV
jgi:hypothetical protein